MIVVFLIFGLRATARDLRDQPPSVDVLRDVASVGAFLTIRGVMRVDVSLCV